MTRHEDDSYLGIGLAEHFRHFAAVHARHHDIGQQHRNGTLMLPSHCHRFGAVGRADRAIAQPFEHAAGYGANLAAVFHYQN